MQDDKAEGQEADDSKGIEMEGDFEGALEDMQADPDADDQEQDSGDEERLDQVWKHPWPPSICDKFVWHSTACQALFLATWSPTKRVWQANNQANKAEMLFACIAQPVSL